MFGMQTSFLIVHRLQLCFDFLSSPYRDFYVAFKYFKKCFSLGTLDLNVEVK